MLKNDNFGKIKKFNLNEDILDFEEDWEDIEETPEYAFLKSMNEFINKTSKTGLNTRKFLRMAGDLVNKGEVSQKTFDDFITQEELNPKIVKEFKDKKKKPMKKSPPSSSSYDPCSHGGGSRQSSC